MRSLLLVPEALVAGTAILLLLGGQLGFVPRTWHTRLPSIVAAVVVVAFIVELWVGGTLSSLFGGGFIQDRFALFAKAAALLAVAAAIAVADWNAEDSTTVSLSMTLLAAFGVMVAASAGDFVPLWAGLELAAAAGVVLVSLRRPDLGLRLVIAGGMATALFVMGFAFVYATAGTADLLTAHKAMANSASTLPLAIPILLLFGGLAVRAGIAPFHIANVPANSCFENIALIDLNADKSRAAAKTLAGKHLGIGDVVVEPRLDHEDAGARGGLRLFSGWFTFRCGHDPSL